MVSNIFNQVHDIVNLLFCDIDVVIVDDVRYGILDVGFVCNIVLHNFGFRLVYDVLGLCGANVFCNIFRDNDFLRGDIFFIFIDDRSGCLFISHHNARECSGPGYLEWTCGNNFAVLDSKVCQCRSNHVCSDILQICGPYLDSTGFGWFNVSTAYRPCPNLFKWDVSGEV